MIISWQKIAPITDLSYIQANDTIMAQNDVSNLRVSRLCTTLILDLFTKRFITHGKLIALSLKLIRNTFNITGLDGEFFLQLKIEQWTLNPSKSLR